MQQIWDKRTGEPLYDAVLWHDARTRETAQALEASLGGQDALRATCGLPISTYFSGVKLRWLQDNVPAVKEGLANVTLTIIGCSLASFVCCQVRPAPLSAGTPRNAPEDAAFAVE